MPRIRPLALASLAALAFAAPARGQSADPCAVVVLEEDIRWAMEALAHDSAAGRRTGEPEANEAAVWLAYRFAQSGVEPVAEAGYLQPVPFATDDGRRLRLATFEELAELPADRRRQSFNVVGMVTGTDPALRHEVVVVAAHYDHVGIGRPNEAGDSIYNGADDDASGTVAVLEIARALARNPPKRSVLFFLATGEELGMLGTQWYLQHPVVPLENTVAGLMIEMIGRPDEVAGGHGRAWLTGYERSTVGRMLADAGVPIVPDPRPAQNFFERSDNTPFARLGIPAHALSSFGLHGDYHTPDDEADRLDYAHMARVIEAAIRAVYVLADGPRPAWNPGGRPN